MSNDKNKNERNSNSNYDPGEGLVFKIGNKVVDPHDIRLHRPHCRIPPPYKSTGSVEFSNSGGLLQTGDHRPVVNSAVSNSPAASTNDKSGTPE